MRRVALTAVAGLAAVAAACSRPAPAATDDALRQDLEAARASADAPAPRTQFVSAVELGRTPDAPSRTGPERVVAGPGRARATTSRPVARRAASTAAVVPVARTRPAAPLPADVRSDVDEADDAPEAEDRPHAPSVDAPPAPDRQDPVVAAPSRRPVEPPPPPPRRRGRVWDMGDVIRNAPFPINPARAGR